VPASFGCEVIHWPDSWGLCMAPDLSKWWGGIKSIEGIVCIVI